ncbi:MAG: S-ribosylhomocysteine lyase, partial [Enterococcus sp.]
MKMNVESFNLDHTKVEAPYIRVADKKIGPNGDVIVKYDVRLKQPNQDHM